MEINALSMDFLVKDIDQSGPLQSKYHQLMQLEEQREKEITAIERRKADSKRNFDQKVTQK